MATKPKLKRRSAPKDKLRPSWWGPEPFLAWRAAHPLVRLDWQYQLWADEWGCTKDSIIAEVRRWRKTLAPYTWKGVEYDSYEAALFSLDPAKRSGEAIERGRGVEDPLWRERFVVAYREESYNRKTAAEKAGIPWETIRKKLKPGGSEYDPLLVALIEEEDDAVRELARAGNATALKLASKLAVEQKDIRAVAVLAKHSLDNLERLEPDKFGRYQKVEIQGRVTHALVNVREDALQRALQVSQQAVALPPAPEPGLEIEGVIVSEEVR